MFFFLFTVHRSGLPCHLGCSWLLDLGHIRVLLPLHVFLLCFERSSHVVAAIVSNDLVRSYLRLKKG